MSSGLPLKADIARCSWHVANVPRGDLPAINIPIAIEAKAVLALNKMLKLVNGKFLITDDTFHQITNRD